MHVMHHTTHIFYTCTLILCIVNFGVSEDTQGSGIVYTAERRICQNITWKLESHAVYVNLTKVLKKGDGQERNVKYKVLTSGLVNVTTTTLICCPGFKENHKKKCKSKLFMFTNLREILPQKKKNKKKTDNLRFQ
ncbi:Hypothetical predicted protein [Mytilus galloprovincialis]|uniref:Uncharacterized protein n=2 Tax=Mytilus galloprovincialis TaxID=29158 RepID=A0A8B6BUF3_MYTGA|nr:Hypothetical predicted protein [Mytilus galloprovincialis]